jgi:hypothetical protein
MERAERIGELGEALATSSTRTGLYGLTTATNAGHGAPARPKVDESGDARDGVG